MNKLKLTTGLMLFASIAMAQTTSESAPIMNIHLLLMGIIVILIVVLFLLLIMLKRVMHILTIETNGGKLQVETEQTFWEKALSLKPLSAEKEVELDHDFDGIKELNNPIPFWFNLLFYSTIVAAFVYLMVFHVFKVGSLQGKEYETEMANAEISKQEYIKKAGNLIDENTVVLITDKAKISEGAALFTSKCVVCHGEKAEGKVGPNLTDEYWLHGGDVKSIFKTITYGVPSKGMVAWQNSMNGGQIQLLASYILSLQGSNPPGAKEPQGEKVSGAAVTDSTAIIPVDSVKTK
ncbi:MAG: c-type cytochrome [Bacteroidetes bacterium]|nr:c-type cytochrome [Bacteroidota bacterium]